jgi:hypothetical protein
LPWLQKEFWELGGKKNLLDTDWYCLYHLDKNRVTGIGDFHLGKKRKEQTENFNYLKR